jgi:hypothetical protein
MRKLNGGIKLQKHVAYLLYFQATAQSKHSPIGRIEFAQSGHPEFSGEANGMTQRHKSLCNMWICKMLQWTYELGLLKFKVEFCL